MLPGSIDGKRERIKRRKTKVPELKLIESVPDRNGNVRQFLELEDGRKLPLPHQVRLEEFAFEGNVVVQADERIIAAYDPSTYTGCIYWGNTESPYWSMVQPCVREDFFGRMVLSAISDNLSR